MNPSPPLLWTSAPALAATLALAALLVAPGEVRAQDDDPAARWEFFMEQRRYPGTTDLAARLQAAREEVLLAPTRRTAPAGAPLSTEWTPLGPEIISWFGNSTGRASAIAIHPDDPETLYIGGAQGGVWKTTDGGASWTPLTDDECSLAMGAIAIDPVDPDIVYAGTGEHHFSGDSYYGCGILRSVDGGQTWTRQATAVLGGPGAGGKVARIAVDPSTAGTTGATRVWAATDRGFYRSDDSGLTWDFTLGGNMTDMVIDPTDPTKIYVGARGTGVLRSSDGGTTWTELTLGADPALLGRVNLAIGGAGHSGSLYAAVHDRTEGDLEGLYRTFDGGNTWLERDASGASCGTQCWYDLALAVDPDDPQIVYFGGVLLSRSDNGGQTFQTIMGSPSIHVDQHYILVDPDQPDRVLVANDGGIYESVNRGASWTSLNTNLSMTQFYPGVSIHPSDASVVLGGTQDNGTVQYGGGPVWPVVLGGDGGYTAIDPVNPLVRYGETQWGFGGPRRSEANSPFFPVNAGIDLNENAAFIPPLVMDPYEPTVLYFGTTRVYRTTNRGDQWEAISPDFQGRVVSAIAPARSDGDVVWAATAGRVHRTADGGETWSTSAQAEGVPNRWLTDIAVHPDDAGTAWVTASGFGGAHVVLTQDGGQSWTNMSSGLPDMPVNAVLLDPDDPTLVYLGTDLGVWIGGVGRAWERLGEGFPMVAVFDLAVEPGSSLLVAATHGRGMFSLPLEAELDLVLRAPAERLEVFTADDPVESDARVGVYGTGWPTAGWTADTGSDWIDVLTPAGTGREALRWAVDPGSLALGTHRDSIRVSVSGGPQGWLPVEVEVTGSDVLEVDRRFGSAEAAVGSDTPVPDSATVSITGPTAPQREWQATHGGGAWLDLVTAQGMTGERVRWARDPDGLAAGTYVDTLVITAAQVSGSPWLVVDTFMVAPPLASDVDRPSAEGLSLAGLDAPAPDSVRVLLTGLGADTTTWTVTHRGTPWLTLSGSGGRGAGVVRWQRSAANLGEGVHLDTLDIHFPARPDLDRMVVDTFRVGAPVPPAHAAEELLDGGRLDGIQRDVLDRLGNGDGTFNLGDVLSWLARCGGGGSAGCVPPPPGPGGLP